MASKPKKSSKEQADLPEPIGSQSIRQIDWGRVNLPDAKGRKINQSGWLSAKDYVWLTVTAKLLKKTVAQVLVTAVLTYLRRNFSEHLQILDFIANQKGISREEAIERIYGDELEL